MEVVKWVGGFIAAVLAGYLLSYLYDRLILRRFSEDRFSSIIGSCVLTFLTLMGATTIYLTMTTPFPGQLYVPGGSPAPGGPIIIPPITFFLGYFVAVALVGAVRANRYGKEYEYNDDQLVFDPDLDDQSLYDDEVNRWDEKNAGRNYFHRHWAGHLPLPLAYWVNSFLLTIVIVIIAEVIARRLHAAGSSLRVMAIVTLSFLVVSLLVWVWSSVGIWRSAYWHRKRGGTELVGMGVRLLVILGAVGILFRTGDMVLQARELGSLALGKDPMGDIADMKVSPDGTQLVMRGTIAMGTAERFAALVDASPKLERVVLTSEGGRLLEAERMADRIRKEKLDTRVDDHCMSACTHMLIAGQDRTAPNRARIGFHAPSFPGMSGAQSYAAAERMRADYVEAGVEPSFAFRAIVTPAASMWFPTPDELVAANVITSSDVVIRAASRSAADDTPREGESLSDQRLRADLKAEAAMINKRGSRQVGPGVRLDRASASGFTLTLHYVVDVDRLDLERSRRAVTQLARAEVCNAPQLASAVYDGASFVYAYANKKGKPLLSVTVSDCRA
jgi:hypothetical protein